MISDIDYDGLALENDTAFVEASGKQFIIGSRKDAKAWFFTEHKKQELEVIICSDHIKKHTGWNRKFIFNTCKIL